MCLRRILPTSCDGLSLLLGLFLPKVDDENRSPLMLPAPSTAQVVVAHRINKINDSPRLPRAKYHGWRKTPLRLPRAIINFVYPVGDDYLCS